MVRGKVAAGSLCCPFGTSPDRATVRTRRQRERDDALLSAELPQTAVNEPDQAAVGTSTIPMQSTVDSVQSTIRQRAISYPQPLPVGAARDFHPFPRLCLRIPQPSHS